MSRIVIRDAIMASRACDQLVSMDISLREGDCLLVGMAPSTLRRDLAMSLAMTGLPGLRVLDGSITIEGVIAPFPPLSRAFDHRLTIWENLWMLLDLSGVRGRKAEVQRIVRAIISDAMIPDEAASRPLSALAMHEKGQLSTALLLHLPWSVLVCEEWPVQGSPPFRAWAMERLRDRLKQASAIIFTCSAYVLPGLCPQFSLWEEGTIRPCSEGSFIHAMRTIWSLSDDLAGDLLSSL